MGEGSGGRGGGCERDGAVAIIIFACSLKASRFGTACRERTLTCTLSSLCELCCWSVSNTVCCLFVNTKQHGTLVTVMLGYIDVTYDVSILVVCNLQAEHYPGQP